MERKIEGVPSVVINLFLLTHEVGLGVVFCFNKFVPLLQYSVHAKLDNVVQLHGFYETMSAGS